MKLTTVELAVHWTKVVNYDLDCLNNKARYITSLLTTDSVRSCASGVPDIVIRLPSNKPPFLEAQFHLLNPGSPEVFPTRTTQAHRGAMASIGDTCDSLFGPMVSQHDCRGGFDFTGTCFRYLGTWTVSTYTNIASKFYSRHGYSTLLQQPVFFCCYPFACSSYLERL